VAPLDLGARGGWVTVLNEHRDRRGDVRQDEPTPSGPPASSVTVIVLALSGAVDEKWLRELVATYPVRSAVRESIEPPESNPGPSEQVPVNSRTPRTNNLSAGSLRMDLDEMRVSLSGRTISLARQEFLLLETFMRHPNRVLSRDRLLAIAWGSGDWLSERTVDVHVRRLRVKLGQPSPQISTVRGFGYRFDVPPGKGNRPDAPVTRATATSVA
jgi:DNA-binding winged helix-turn-helix (wHTH) protein